MDVRAVLSFVVAGVAVLAASQTGSFFLKDKAGKSSITNPSGVKLTTLPNNRTAFLVMGNPFTFTSELQKLTLRAKKMEGTAKSVSGAASYIEKMTLSEIAEIVIKRPSRKPGAAQEQTIEIDTSSLVYTHDNERLAFDRPVTVNQQDKPSSQSFRVSGGSGWVGLYPADAPQRSRQAIKGLRLEGPVTFELHSLVEVEDSARPGQKVMKPFKITGKGRLMTYDDASRKMTLDQDVEIDGTHPTMIGQMKAMRAILTLDENWNPTEIEMVGEPGETRLNPPPGRGLSR